MKIAVIDEIVINAEQLKRLKALGELEIFSGVPTNKEEIIKRVGDADIIISGWTNFFGDVIDSFNNVKMISIWSTGFDHIDVEKAKNKGIVVANVPGYAKNAVGELAVGLMLDVIRNITIADKRVRKNRSFDSNMFQGMELSGKTIGIIGTGAIGCRVAQIASGLDMRILACDPYPKNDIVEKYNVCYCSRDEIFERSDVVTLHMPLLPSTYNLITAKDFAKMKQHAIFINTARSKLVNQDDLYQVLKDKKILGAGLDDIDLSMQSGMDIIDLDNVVLTPHIGYNTKEAVTTETDICIDNVCNFIDKKDCNEVKIV